MKLLLFTSHSCGVCGYLKKAKTVPLFVQSMRAKDEELEAHEIEIDDDNGNTVKKAHVEAYKLSDVYDVQALPGLLFVTDGGQLLAEVAGAANAVTLERTFKKAKEAEAKLLAAGEPKRSEAFDGYMKKYGEATLV